MPTFAMKLFGTYTTLYGRRIGASPIPTSTSDKSTLYASRPFGPRRISTTLDSAAVSRAPPVANTASTTLVRPSIVTMLGTLTLPPT